MRTIYYSLKSLCPRILKDEGPGFGLAESKQVYKKSAKIRQHWTNRMDISVELIATGCKAFLEDAASHNFTQTGLPPVHVHLERIGIAVTA